MMKHLSRIRRKIRQWLRSEGGTTAIEFSVLAVPFTMFLVAIIELSMYFAASSLMEGAVQDAARRIRTGELQQTSGQDPAEVFSDALCANSLYILDCRKFQFQVQTLDSFSDFETVTAPEFDEDGNLITPPFDSGGSGDVVMIRVFYRYPMLTPLIGQFFSDGPNHTKLMMSTVVMQVEPYQA